MGKRRWILGYVLVVLAAWCIAPYGVHATANLQAEGNCPPDEDKLLFTYTVGPGPECGQSSTILVPAGSKVVFCLEAANGDTRTENPIKWEGYSITDSCFGTVTEVPWVEFNSVLSPGESIGPFLFSRTVTHDLVCTAILSVTTDRDSTEPPLGPCSYQIIRSVTVKVAQEPVPPPEGVPTLSQWGMMIMGLILATAAVLLILRRKTN